MKKNIHAYLNIMLYYNKLIYFILYILYYFNVYRFLGFVFNSLSMKKIQLHKIIGVLVIRICMKKLNEILFDEINKVKIICNDNCIIKVSLNESLKERGNLVKMMSL